MTNGRVSEILSGESLTLIEGEASVNTFFRSADQAKDDVHLSREREKDTNYHRMCSQYTKQDTDDQLIFNVQPEIMHCHS